MSKWVKFCNALWLPFCHCQCFCCSYLLRWFVPNFCCIYGEAFLIFGTIFWWSLAVVDRWSSFRSYLGGFCSGCCWQVVVNTCLTVFEWDKITAKRKLKLFIGRLRESLFVIGPIFKIFSFPRNLRIETLKSVTSFEAENFSNKWYTHTCEIWPIET